MKEEAVWTITNLALKSSEYESEFEEVARAMIEIVKLNKIDNLGALLNLKEQCI